MSVIEGVFVLFPTIIGITISFFVGVAVGLGVSFSGLGVGFYCFKRIPGFRESFLAYIGKD